MSDSAAQAHTHFPTKSAPASQTRTIGCLWLGVKHPRRGACSFSGGREASDFRSCAEEGGRVQPPDSVRSHPSPGPESVCRTVKGDLRVRLGLPRCPLPGLSLEAKVLQVGGSALQARAPRQSWKEAGRRHPTRAGHSRACCQRLWLHPGPGVSLSPPLALCPRAAPSVRLGPASRSPHSPASLCDHPDCPRPGTLTKAVQLLRKRRGKT